MRTGICGGREGTRSPWAQAPSRSWELLRSRSAGRPWAGASENRTHTDLGSDRTLMLPRLGHVRNVGFSYLKKKKKCDSISGGLEVRGTLGAIRFPVDPVPPFCPLPGLAGHAAWNTGGGRDTAVDTAVDGDVETRSRRAELCAAGAVPAGSSAQGHSAAELAAGGEAAPTGGSDWGRPQTCT